MRTFCQWLIPIQYNAPIATYPKTEFLEMFDGDVDTSVDLTASAGDDAEWEFDSQTDATWMYVNQKSADLNAEQYFGFSVSAVSDIRALYTTTGDFEIAAGVSNPADCVLATAGITTNQAFMGEHADVNAPINKIVWGDADASTIDIAWNSVIHSEEFILPMFEYDNTANRSFVSTPFPGRVVSGQFYPNFNQMFTSEVVTRRTLRFAGLTEAQKIIFDNAIAAFGNSFRPFVMALLTDEDSGGGADHFKCDFWEVLIEGDSVEVQFTKKGTYDVSITVVMLSEIEYG